MGDDGDGPYTGSSRFELSPPRHFLLPAVLMLLCEKPSYGYALLPELADLCLGSVDRPAVYRALAQLQRDGLVEDFSQSPKAGPSRRVYTVTPAGERVLRSWMGVMKETHDHLGRVLRRYQALGTADAVLAEVEGGWSAALGPGWSPVSPSPVPSGHPVPVPRPEQGRSPLAVRAHPAGRPGLFRLLPERSVVLIEVRSTVGPLSFGAIGLRGWIGAALRDGRVDPGVAPRAHLEVDVSGLRSGNQVYDSELLRRIDARRHPVSAVDLEECTPAGGNLYVVNGSLTFHGVTRPAGGTVTLEVGPEGELLVTGEQAFDIRDFSVPSPTMLMLRIYPDVKVRLHAEAVLEQMPWEVAQPC